MRLDELRGKLGVHASIRYDACSSAFFEFRPCIKCHAAEAELRQISNGWSYVCKGPSCDADYSDLEAYLSWLDHSGPSAEPVRATKIEPDFGVVKLPMTYDNSPDAWRHPDQPREETNRGGVQTFSPESDFLLSDRAGA